MYKMLSNNSCALFKAFCKCLGGDHDHDHHDHSETHDQQTDANSTSEAERQMKITEDKYGKTSPTRVEDQRSPSRLPISSAGEDQINGEENDSLARSPPRPPISSRVGDQIEEEEDGLLARSPPRPPISSRGRDHINNGEEDGSLARSPPRPPISSRVGALERMISFGMLWPRRPLSVPLWPSQQRDNYLGRSLTAVDFRSGRHNGLRLVHTAVITVMASTAIGAAFC
ncbi:hypothetical protein LWI28_017774 [Acer negundo]|uniref:Uncharacterized protein n=1 Tax=Acer negundo TaxID=4023 RepID=A0AAD5NLW8_ACENE|nr:hypothetical protein LWI28_017774 [Acer negundo]